MNYNIDLPEELKSVSMPKLKIIKKKLIIFNRPYLMDWIFRAIIIIIFFVMIINGELSLTNTDYSDYAILVLMLFFLLIIQYLSLNKVCVDFEKEFISIKNYNPLINMVKKILQMPFIISFREVQNIYTDSSFFSNQLPRFFVVLETIALCKFKIAIFQEDKNRFFSDYLRDKIVK